MARVRTADGQHEAVGVHLPAQHAQDIVDALREQAPELGALRAAAAGTGAAEDAAPRPVRMLCSYSSLTDLGIAGSTLGNKV